MKLHLFDGTYELFRAFYGAPGAHSASGQEVGATRSLLRSLAGFVRHNQATHVAVAFDHVIESFRNDLFAGYKTGEGIDPDLFAQFPLAEEASRALGITTWAMIEFEADDALATAAHRFADAEGVEQVVILTPDKDLMQCVRQDKVVVHDRVRKRTYDEAAVIAKFGVPPSAIPDYLALVGDSADGLPGVPRWGSKSAAALLSAYGALERIPDDERTWSVRVRGAPALAASLRAAREESLLYRRLATLRTDVPLVEELDDLRWRGPAMEALEDLCERIGDRAVMESLGIG